MEKTLKKILVSLLCLMVLLTVSPAFVFAETTTPAVTETAAADDVATTTTSGTVTDTATDEDVAEEAGVTPDSWIYPIEQMIESVQVAITFTQEGKAELLISFANERLAEAQVMTEKNQMELVKRLIASYTKTVELANLQIQKAVEDKVTDASQTENTTDTANSTDPTATENADNTNTTNANDATDTTSDTNATTEGTTEETDTVTTPADEDTTAWVNDVIEKIEIVQNDADKIVIKLTGLLPEDQADEMEKILTAQVQNTIALKAYCAAKKGYVEAVHEYAQAKKELGLAKSTGDETAVKAAEAKVEEAKQLKEDMKDVRKDVLQLKNEVRKENKEILKEIAKDFNKADYFKAKYANYEKFKEYCQNKYIDKKQDANKDDDGKTQVSVKNYTKDNDRDDKNDKDKGNDNKKVSYNNRDWGRDNDSNKDKGRDRD